MLVNLGSTLTAYLLLVSACCACALVPHACSCMPCVPRAIFSCASSAAYPFRPRPPISCGDRKSLPRRALRPHHGIYSLALISFLPTLILAPCQARPSRVFLHAQSWSSARVFTTLRAAPTECSPSYGALGLDLATVGPGSTNFGVERVCPERLQIRAQNCGCLRLVACALLPALGCLRLAACACHRHVL